MFSCVWVGFVAASIMLARQGMLRVRLSACCRYKLKAKLKEMAGVCGKGKKGGGAAAKKKAQRERDEAARRAKAVEEEEEARKAKEEVVLEEEDDDL